MNVVSNIDVRRALRSVVVGALQAAAVTLEADEVAWENRAFDNIEGLYVTEHLMPTTASPMATNAAGGRGIYQLMVYGVKGTGTEDIEGLAADLQALYPPGAQVYNGTAIVSVTEARVASAMEVDGRWVCPVRVYYLVTNI